MADNDTITIYHNPRCSNSRGALALLEAQGIQPQVIDYLHAQLSTAHLTALITQLGVPVREVMRSKEAIYQDLDLGRDSLSDDELIAEIAAHPELLNRPIVVSPKGARLCRPPERVLDLL
ncbi:arsenate reductase (glutaredoxin) [Comamonas piscis]|uniref:Arsenate reductase n=1 Tax=Comamonas piscis TaxID=1562974 RepID=A0A7G5EF15_9BURK|nr:arsenate reductase (glutaredoxin) [Comamonas piscis]QMV72590.1 arsenate reductase (glutaredoxin) [Comamonas piscis]WSO35361.1 arsenate reductase (glutaredoxin) [Comamonas piscis]